MIKDLKVQIDQGILDDLKLRIKNSRWPDQIVDSGWTYGASMPYMKELAEYWLDGFDWRKTEAQINQYPNFIASLDGLNIHFIHVKGKGENAIPLIITHGWPSSFLELMKLIPGLSDHEDLAFDLVIPSMMGYGFSQKVDVPGCNVSFMADLWFKLMVALGYEKFGVQGGDFGAGVSTEICIKYPDHVIGMHLNYIPGNYHPELQENEVFSDEEKLFLQSADEWYLREGGYSLQQKTKPLTLAYGLNDSPLGLCAWIIEKMYGWAHCEGNIENVFSKDELLSNVTLYWVTETIHSSIRLYNENAKSPIRLGRDSMVKVPVGIARFRYEEPFPPRKFVERGFKVQQWSEFPEGGHFAGMEKPGLLVEDIFKFFSMITNS